MLENYVNRRDQAATSVLVLSLPLRLAKGNVQAHSFCANTSAASFVKQTEVVVEVSEASGGGRVTESNEQRLVNHLRAGRPEACAELVRTHYAAVYRFLLHQTRDVHQAEDLTQETFTTAWEKIATFEGRATLATWLHRIAYTKFIDAQRAERRAVQVRARLVRPQATRSDPCDAMTADDEARRLYQALQELNAADRSVLVLHYLQGLSYREMATVLDEPAGTVKWRTSEALNRLRARLCEEGSNHAPRKASEPGPIC
jgi:RNA polymerase sigma-70 factor (ECF subfamily)